MTFASFLIDIYSHVPHLNFKFQWTKDIFNLDFRSEYFQSLDLLCFLGAAICLLLLITIIIVWICQSCRKNETTGKTRRRVRKLSTVLFIISVLCFFMLGICLFANEHVNRGMSISINSIINVKRSHKIALTQIAKLHEAAQNTTTHLKGLEDVVHEESKKVSNHSLVSEIDTLLTKIGEEVEMNEKMGKKSLTTTEDEIENLERIRKVTSTYESERWAFLVIVLSITMCVLFAGVISFCRQSKSGAVAFSAIGFFIFLVVWALIAVIFPLTIALSDFCRQGDQVTREQLDKIYEKVRFYNSCTPSPTHDVLPEPIASQISMVNNIPSLKSKLDRAMEVAFNSSGAITNSSSIVGDDITKLLKLAGAVSASSACYVFHEDVVNFYYGVCDQSVAGMSVHLISIFLLGILLFVLLIIVSKTWHLFSRLPHEYVEVDDDDPFFPRGGGDSAIPVDIYGTHVFNPRTRDRTDPSTNTTTATAADEQSTPLWSQSTSAAPGSNSMARQAFMAESYGNYADRYDM